MAIMVCI
jgi:alkylation response protein AidB-like acyl-CoA dehydrogenase